MQRLLNKKTLITGASSGIGQAIAIAYAKEGAEVVFTYCTNKEGAEVTLAKIQEVGGNAYALSADMKNMQEVRNLVENANQLLNGIDILVNNAGMLTRHVGFLEIPEQDFEDVQVVNLKAPFILMQKVAKQMQTQNSGGCIINISSVSANVITPGLTHYECSKAALHTLTKSVASDLAKNNIRVNAIAPGLVATNINKTQRENDPQAWQQRSARIPLGQVGRPQDIASMAVYLATPEAQWITGSIISIDGGISVVSPF